MSFPRLIFYCAVVGGWAAFAGWALCELCLMHRSGQVGYGSFVLTGAFTGGLIGAALNFLAGAANGNVRQAVPRLGVGFLAGLVGGGIGCVFGNLLFWLIHLRVLGWIIMGLGIGVVEGVSDLNIRKIRNGLIGGGVGGLLGGLFFDFILFVVNIPMSSRAVGLVLLGVSIGLSIGLAQVMLREAWLTVEEGFRPGRQLLLSKQQTYLGTSEKAQLSFIAYGAKGVEPMHLCITRQTDGTYWILDNGSRTGTFVNDQQVREALLLKDGDVVRFGANKVRFNERYRQAGSRAAKPPVAPQARPVAQVPQAIAAAFAAPPAGQPVPVAVAVAPAPRPMPVAVPVPAVPAPRPPLAEPRVTPLHMPTQVSLAAPTPVAVAPRGTDECPVCGMRSSAPPSKRRCDNCGIPF